MASDQSLNPALNSAIPTTTFSDLGQGLDEKVRVRVESTYNL